MSDLILKKLEGRIASLTLNRPQRHNSLIPELLQALLDALEYLEKIPDLRVVILKANGPSFSNSSGVPSPLYGRG